MGYETEFVLKIRKDGKNKHLSSAKFNLEIESKDGEVAQLFEYGSIKSKWYTHEDDMREVSLLNLEYLFILYGRGEEDSDMWAKVFHQGDGYQSVAKITFPDVVLDDGTTVALRLPS